MRINKELLRIIVNNILLDTTIKQREDATDERRAVGDRIADRIEQFDGVVDVLKSAPARYFDQNNNIRVALSDFATEINEYQTFIGEIRDDRFDVYMTNRKTFANAGYNLQHVFPTNDGDIVEYQRLNKIVCDLIQKVEKSRKELSSMLATFSTTEKLIAQLPDFEKYVPAEARGNATKSLAIRAEDIKSYVEQLAA